MKRINKYCPMSDNKYSALVIVFMALGITLWGVIAIISGLMDNYYQELGYWITVGDIIVLVFSVGGLIFFGFVLWFFIQCKNPNEIEEKNS